MADLRIVDAPEIPTENITGEEKLPTGGNGNYSISLDSLADYTKTKKDLVDNTSVDGKVNGVRQELDAHIEDLLNPHQVTKGQIGLGNVDNTADADKPVSNSTQAAIISAVAPKADKTYVDNALSSKSDKTYVDNALSSKSDKTYVDSQLALKANKVDVYTKSETYTKQESSDLVNNSISTALTPVNSSLDLAKRGIANRYDSSLVYNSGERVILNNGDIVKSTVANNTANPNVGMAGWVLSGNTITVETVADLIGINNPNDGDVAYVKSYYKATNFASAQPFKGGGTRIYVASRKAENDGFLCINGWVLDLYLDEVSVYSGGIRGNGLDETDKLETIITKAKGKNINLEGLTIKTNGFRIGSNTKIFNGTLDFSSSNIIDPNYRFYDGYIIGDNRPRSYNAEYNPNYASLPQLENIEIDNIEFVLPTNPTNAYRAVFFHKINGLKFTNNRLESSNHHTWLQVVGGHDGIDLSNVTPQKYVRNMPNGRCSNIVISGNYMKTDWDSTKTAFYQNRLCHIVSSENIDCSYNTVINTPCAIAIDHFNRSASIQHNFYEADKAIVNTLYQYMDGADSMAYYVGQGSYDVTVSDNYAHNYGQAGVYIEAAKAVSVKSNRLSVDSGINTNISKVGIQLQSNVYFQAGNNTNVVGNVSDCNVFDNVVYSATRAFETNGIYNNSHEKINVFGNTFSSINSLGAVTLHNIYQSTFNSNNIFSTLNVSKTDTLSIFDNTVLSSRNYALNLNADEKYSTTIKNNKFKGFNYASLISNSLSHDFVISKNLLELDQNMNLVNKTGSGNLKIIDFILNDSFSLQSESLNIAAGAITGVLLTCDVSKPEWGVDISLVRWQGLSILASYTQEGSIVAIVQNTGSTTFSGKVDFRAKLHSMIFS